MHSAGVSWRAPDGKRVFYGVLCAPYGTCLLVFEHMDCTGTAIQMWPLMVFYGNRLTAGVHITVFLAHHV